MKTLNTLFSNVSSFVSILIAAFLFLFLSLGMIVESCAQDAYTTNVYDVQYNGDNVELRIDRFEDCRNGNDTIYIGRYVHVVINDLTTLETTERMYEIDGKNLPVTIPVNPLDNLAVSIAVSTRTKALNRYDTFKFSPTQTNTGRIARTANTQIEYKEGYRIPVQTVKYSQR